jgi:hypothetical protein
MNSLIKGYGREESLGTTGLDNRFTEGSGIVSSTRLPRFTPKKHYLVLIYVRG